MVSFISLIVFDILFRDRRILNVEYTDDLLYFENTIACFLLCNEPIIISETTAFIFFLPSLYRYLPIGFSTLIILPTSLFTMIYSSLSDRV